jgi:hypothetical protein
VTETEVEALDARARASADELVRAGSQVRYVGSILMREDKVLLCLFGGAQDAVRRAAEMAQIPFERILAATGSPWPISAQSRQEQAVTE